MTEKKIINNQDKKLKFIIVGDAFAGKTALFWTYTDSDYFNQDLSTEITTIDFRMKTIQLNQQKIKLYIWDTAGQQKFRSIVSTYFKGCQGVILVFDQSNPISFDHLIKDWYPLVLSKTQNAKCILVGCKIDLERNVSQEEIRSWSEQHKIKYIQTSSKQRINISVPFEELTKQILLKKPDSEIKIFEKSQSMNLRADSKGLLIQKESKCCFG